MNWCDIIVVGCDRMVKFVKSKSMKIEVLENQEKFLSNQEKIKNSLNRADVIAFDIFNNQTLIGFVMLKKFDVGCYFLWDFAIDYRYQNKNYGTESLKELIKYMNKKYQMHTMTTTYTYGNNHAKHIYEKIGFIETDIVNDNECHEINMIYFH